MKKFILPLLIAFSFESILASKVQTLDDEAVSWLQEYLQVDTVNPPGNESRAVNLTQQKALRGEEISGQELKAEKNRL